MCKYTHNHLQRGYFLCYNRRKYQKNYKSKNIEFLGKLDYQTLLKYYAKITVKSAVYGLTVCGASRMLIGRKMHCTVQSEHISRKQ